MYDQSIIFAPEGFTLTMMNAKENSLQGPEETHSWISYCLITSDSLTSVLVIEE